MAYLAHLLFGYMAHEMHNEFYLISEVAFDCPSLLFCFHKDDVVLIPFQTKARELNGPVKALQSKVHLVAHFVDMALSRTSWTHIAACSDHFWRICCG